MREKIVALAKIGKMNLKHPATRSAMRDSCFSLDRSDRIVHTVAAPMHEPLRPGDREQVPHPIMHTRQSQRHAALAQPRVELDQRVERGAVEVEAFLEAHHHSVET